ncbi:MAG TPA: hypothetical protein VF070_29475 [Streptosporangiaceae bacterium]
MRGKPASPVLRGGRRSNAPPLPDRGAKKAKRRQHVSGYWHSLSTLGRWCRLSSYLHSAAAHGTAALDAVCAVIEGKPWLPPLPAVS